MEAETSSHRPLDETVVTETADWFSRDSLLDTVKLLRRNNPSLALRIQNQLMGSVVEIRSTDKAPQKVQLQLDGFTLKRVVDGLADLGNELAREVLEQQTGDYDELIIVRDVIGRWLDYARFHRQEVARRQELGEQAMS